MRQIMINFSVRAGQRRRRRGADDRQPIRRAKFIAGGTNLVDLMKEDVERPSRLIDISRLPLRTRRGNAPTAACASARWCRTPTSPSTR